MPTGRHTDPGAASMSLIVPTVSEQTPRGERLVDLYSRLLNSRIVFLGTQVDETSANLVIAQLLHLDADAPGQGHPPLHQLPRRRHDRAVRHLRHDEVPALATWPRSASARRARPPRCSSPPAPRASATCCPTPGCSSTNPTAAPRASRATSSWPWPRWSRCDGGWSTSWSRPPASPRSASAADIDRDYILRGDDVVAYGLADEVITTRS